MQLHSDDGFTKDRLFDEVQILLFASISELRVFALPFQDLFHVLHVDPLIFSALLLLPHLLRTTLEIRLHLEDANTSIFDRFRHDIFAILLKLPQFFIVLH